MTYRANAYRLCTALFALLVVAAATVAPAHGQQADMLGKIGYVSSGVVEIMQRQQQGWAYIRP